MIKKHGKIAFRQLRRQKFYTLINTSGLALSVACCLLMVLFIRHELSYDQHHEKADRIHRLALDINLNQSVAIGTAMPSPLAKTLVADFPEIENAARLNPFFFNAGSNILQIEGQAEGVHQEKFVYADQSFTEMFDFEHVFGNPENWLMEPYQVVVTQRIADRFFGGTNPVGSAIVLNGDADEQRYTISGVVANMPSASHYDFDYFLSMPTLGDSERDGWLANNYFTYVELGPAADPAVLNDKFDAFGLRYFGPAFRERMDIDLEEASASGSKYNLFLQPLADIHLQSAGFGPQLQSNGDIRYVRMFGIIAVFVLLIAMINFINLSTARSSNRAKEVGVRKVLGSPRRQLVAQFLMESNLVCLFGFAIGLGLAHFLLPYFNGIAEKELTMPYGEPWFWPSFLGALLGVGTLAGLYPAFFLSGFQPLGVLQGKLTSGRGGAWMRKGLVVFQFAISTALIIGTLTVYQQMKYIQLKKIGFDKEQVLCIEDTYVLGDRALAFREALDNIPAVENVTVGGYLPLEGGFRNSVSFYPEDQPDGSGQVPIQFWEVDDHYLSTLGMKLLEGRNFAADRPADSLAVILNEAAVQQLDLSDPLDKRIKSPFIDDNYTVIGVVENFNFENLREEVGPLALYLGADGGRIALKSSAADWPQLIAAAETVWEQFAPGQSMRYTFLDESFAQMYAAESRASRLLNGFTMLAIFIACLGLFGLATFTAEQRSKEIGIRKVLGATVTSIVGLLSKDFMQPVLIGLLLACPVAYYFMDQWLADFAYRIDVEWWLFALAGVMCLVLANATIGFQSLKAALANPAKTLKDE